MNNEHADKDLLDRIRLDPANFHVLYDKYFNSIFGYVYRRLGDYELSRDITAETFLKAYKKIDWFEWRKVPLSSWLYKIASNEINQYFRNKKYLPVCLDEINLPLAVYEPGIETEKAALEALLKEHEQFRAIQQELLSLDVKYQEVIALRFFESRSIAEIALILNKKEGTVKSLVSRAISLMREHIRDV